MRQGFWVVKLKGIRRQKRGERMIRYHRATGIRLPDDIPETHPDFIAAWARAEAQVASGLPVRARAPEGSVTAVVHALRLSARYKALSASYRHIIRRETDAIVMSYGTLSFAALRRRHIAADLDRLDANPANARLKAWRLLGMTALKLGIAAEDPTAGVRKQRVVSEGHAPWSAQDIRAYRERHQIGTVARACFELVFWTAARTVDAVLLSRAGVDRDGVLSFRQVKTSGMAHVPWTAPLPAWARSWERERDDMHAALQCLAGGFTFLEVAGRIRSVKGLGNVINDGARAAGLEHRTAHGLRKSRLTMIAEAGGSAHTIMAWGGHRSLSEAQRYTALAATRRLVVGEEQERNDVSLPEMIQNSRLTS